MQAVSVIFFALFVLMALTIAVKLPRYRRMTKIAEQLRSQAVFLEEQRTLLQAIQDSVSDGILLVGENGQLKAFNAAALRILWGRIELQSRPLPELKESAIGALVQGPSDQDTVPWEDRIIERFRTVVPGYGQLYVFRDITEQKRLSEGKESLQARLLEAQRLESLARLAEGVCHEFNNLLTGIMGNAGLALDRLPPSDPSRAILEDVVQASGRAAAVSRQLLAYSGGGGRFAANPVDVSKLVEDIARLAQASIPKRVQLRFELEPELPLADVDAAKVRQVALNLIANGAEAIGGGEGVVTVRTGLEEVDAAGASDLAAGRYVYLEVQDNGCGMDADRQSHIFDPFFTTKSAGRGLGLAAVLGIVKALHGAVTVKSEPGKGSSFRVLLPPAAHSARQRTASAD
jgi:signal transduction histidine kinase